MTNLFFVGQGQNLTNIDAGYVPSQPNNGSIGDRVFADNNGNGQQDNGEPGIGGVTVKLQDANGNTLQQTTTNGNGNYSFTNLASGTYKVMFNTPGGFTQSPANVGNDATDSDNQANQMTDPFFLANGENNPTIDAGFVPRQPNNGSIGDRVFADNNGNGQQDNGEPGIGGVTVKLQDANGNTLQQTTTNGNGNYSFTNLASGTYKVMFNTPGGFTQSPANVGNDATDSDNQANQMTDPFFLANGENNPTIDAGFVLQTGGNKAKVGDFVFRDNNANGIQDPGEPGIQGVFVALYRGDGSFVSFQLSDQNGMYMFGDLDPGSYKLKIVGQPSDLVPSPQDQGGDDSKDSDIDFLGFTATFNLSAGENNPNFDAGFAPSGGPPAICTINANVSNVRCDGSTYSFDVTVNGSNVGDWGWDLPEAGIFTQPFGSTRRVSGVSGTKTFVIVDHDVAGCETTITVNPPAGCNTGGGTGGTGTCSDINISTGNGQININGLTAAIEITKIFDKNWSLIYECAGNCPGSVSQSVSNGEYNVQVQFYTASWGFICEKQERVNVGDGGNTGGGNTGGGNTGGGNSSGGDCDNVNVQSGNGQISVSGWSSPVAIVKIFNSNWGIEKDCSGANCSSPIIANGLGTGTYHIDVQLYTANWQALCTFTQDVNMGNISFDAPNSRVVSSDTRLVKDFEVYPNPASDELFVNMSGYVGQQAIIEVRNQISQIVEQIKLDKVPADAVRIPLNRIQGGLYYISVRVEGGELMTKKVIIE